MRRTSCHRRDGLCAAWSHRFNMEYGELSSASTRKLLTPSDLSCGVLQIKNAKDHAGSRSLRLSPSPRSPYPPSQAHAATGRERVWRESRNPNPMLAELQARRPQASQTQPPQKRGRETRNESARGLHICGPATPRLAR
ncbi:uncharacterized protein N7482_002538 [Penicillium canariense]|uniref:Uncharacterized protein n=1 Tax=Penicillium canariense TaxID=189055 RepID=A0A9W9LU39_9EURO|nr:uncharacterized protein N7482_002538 [Penicillium canariense]KAJ5176661.1 hypothetical protein N7482_002538 [Penicillium canariense]